MEMFIEGIWVEGINHFDVYDPATGQVVDTAVEAGQSDVDKAVSAAAGAFEGYSALPLEKRHEMMKEAAQALKDISADLGPLLVKEQGKPMEQAKQEMFYAGMVLDQFVGLEPKEELIKEKIVKN